MKDAYLELLARARRLTRRSDEAEDLLQAILLSAIHAGRADLSCPNNRRWLEGALRRRAAFEARTAIRRRRREGGWSTDAAAPAGSPLPASFLGALTPSLRTTALLVLTGHAKPEILWLQRLSDAAFRQRVSEIRRRWRESDDPSIEDAAGLAGPLSYGRIRRALLGAAQGEGVALASHDPDGHLFVIRTSSQNDGRRQHGGEEEPAKASTTVRE